MSIDINDKAEVEKRLWTELEQNRFGMLGATLAAGGHFNPMSAYAEPESNTIWFYTNKNTDLARVADGSVAAMFIVMAKDQDFQACIAGELRTTKDLLHRDKYWSPMVAAWFPEGKDDPNLTLMAFSCKDADVWISDAGALKFGWEIAKANLTRAMPDIGGQAHLVFS
jgi:general stress protein 26